MELTKSEINELQENLIIVYKFISQQKKFKKFFYEGIDVKYHFNDENKILKTLMELDDSEELLKKCIIELEIMKSDGEPMTPVGFQEFMMAQDWNLLYKKYGMKTLDDVKKLDLDILLELL